MIVKLNIFNMENFLQVINECRGAINLLTQGNKRENINGQYGIQNELLKKYKKNKNFLQLSLDIANLKDYTDIVFFTIADY
ncbi:ribonuclease HII [Sebaldella sp. S0638]|uniref:ribonuclease HII n=1 Tax=Sebaldella sp. S0638 TaxID=2957809 RepID=UPI0020A2223F|nr:ribonuclease HII [Sebaldella sp. S0638]MCP1226498.1 ribonuclease HII [Sebaldella sp. S0638]